MATFRKRGGTWRVEVNRKGVRRSATFDRKESAVKWASETEAAILSGARGEVPDLAFSALLDRYAREVAAHKKGARFESLRIEAVKRDRIAQEKLRSLSAVHVAAWRDRRLQAVSSASVRREWNILAHACEIAVREWHWLASNPFRMARRPRSSRPRERLFTPEEIGQLEARATTPHRREVMRLVHFCIETGMRAAEACSRPPVDGAVAKLLDTKNGTSREVPLSPAAIALYRAGWSLTPKQLDALFRNMRDEVRIRDLHFHDTRHTACTRLSRKLNVLQLARMLGIKDPRILMVYYNERAADVAKLL